jgi:hypothetical protein
MKMNGLCQKIKLILDKSAINTWSWYYWIFYFAIVPIILTLIPQLPQLLNQTPPNDIVNATFLLNISNPTLISMFFNHYSHIEINHICGNLMGYFLLLIIIFFTVKDKKMFIKSSIFFFLVLPFIASFFAVVYLQLVPVNLPPLRGFSGILYAFFGYIVFLFLKWFFNSIEEKPPNNKLNALSTELMVNTLFFVSIPVLGILVGAYFLNNNPVGDGIVHFCGFICGVLVPTILGIKGVEPFDDKIIFYSIIGMLLYFVYLIRLIP